MRLVRSTARTGGAPAILVAAPRAQAGAHQLGRALAEEALEQTDLPMIMAPQRVEQAWSDSRAVRVLVPLDGSSSAECALARGRLLGSAVERELLVLRVAPDGEARRLGDARRYVEQQAAGAEVGLAVLGDPSTMIAAVARAHRADLIVLTMHARTRLRQPLLGHVIVRVLQHARVPVLLVRPAGDGTLLSIH
jgi:nucleotide-binding universal stress UspA family protein